MRTLPVNLQENWSDRAHVEFVLVDFNPSIDDDRSLQDFVLSRFRQELRSGYLRYFQSAALSSWHASVAKNTAHSVARGRILVNLDGDNFVGKHGARFVARQFFRTAAVNEKNEAADDSGEYWRSLRCTEPRAIVLQQRAGNGTYGRISVRREDFEALGGYNESFAPMSAQDLDLMLRIAALHRSVVTRSNKSIHSYAISNDKERSVRYCTDNRYANMTWRQMKSINAVAMRESRLAHGLLTNVGQPHIGVSPASLHYYGAHFDRLVPYEGRYVVPPNEKDLEKHRGTRPDAFAADRGRASLWSAEQTSRLRQLRRYTSTRSDRAKRRALLQQRNDRQQRLERLKQFADSSG